MGRVFTRQDWWLVGILTVIAGALRFFRLKHPHVIVFDETYFANFAHDYLTHTKFFDAEPPLGKFLIAAGEWLFGFNSFGWRLAPALFGTAVIPLMYILTKRLFGGIRLPLLAALLALLDGLLLVESRTALLDIFVVFFNLLTYTLFFVSLQASSRKRSILWLLLTGVSFGLGLATKWIVLAFIATAIVTLLFLKPSDPATLFSRIRLAVFKVKSESKILDAIGAKRANLHHPLLYLVCLGIVPLIIYLALFQVHVPFDSTGQDLWGIHKQIYNYHQHLQATHPYGSAWYTWPFLIRPVAYYFNSAGGWSGIVALGNPLIWWAGLAGLAFTAWRFVQTRNIILFLILFAFVAHYGPWSMIGRVLFLYHYLGALPFMIIALAYSLSESWRWRPRDTSIQVFWWVILLAAAGVLGGLLAMSAAGSASAVPTFLAGSAVLMAPMVWFMFREVKKLTWGQKQVITFMVLVVLAFVYFYPIWTGISLSPDDYYRHMWLRTWI